MSEELSWHQQNARRRAYRLRNLKAHIHSIDYIVNGKCLCGIKDPPVYILSKHAGNPANNACKKCVAKLNSSRSGETKCLPS